MRTAIDTNVLSFLWKNAPGTERILQVLGECRAEGYLHISPLAYAEALANPGVAPVEVESFLDVLELKIDFDLRTEVWRDAGLRYRSYCERRRQFGGGDARRLPADFIVGSHALLHCDRLFTFDTKRFRIDFPELSLMPNTEKH